VGYEQLYSLITISRTGIRTDPQQVFVSSYGWFAGAATLNFVTICVVLYTFYGWWRLGRPVGFSPLEIAKVSPSQSSPLCFISASLT
jgi:hypothetical protein